MTTMQKGEYAVVKAQLRAVEKGVVVSRPIMEGCRYDLVLDDGIALKRCQVKYGDGSLSNSEGSIKVRLSKDRKNKTTVYEKGEVDALLVYVPKIDKICYFEPEAFEGKPDLVVRLEPSKNGQKKGCLMAEDHLW